MELNEYAFRHSYILFRISASQVDELTNQFFQELKAMYARYAQRQGWQTETLDVNVSWQPHTLKGTLRVLGWQSYAVLSTEAGIHRAQCILSGKKQRIHTALVDMAVVPEASQEEW